MRKSQIWWFSYKKIFGERGLKMTFFVQFTVLIKLLFGLCAHVPKEQQNLTIISQAWVKIYIIWSKKKSNLMIFIKEKINVHIWWQISPDWNTPSPSIVTVSTVHCGPRTLPPMAYRELESCVVWPDLIDFLILYSP